MSNHFPIPSPPDELVRQWTEAASYKKGMAYPEGYEQCEQRLCTAAARWGADQELEACCKWLPKLPPWSGNDLRKHRRPKPPSLKEQALEAQRRMWSGASNHDDWDLVRRALEQLPD